MHAKYDPEFIDPIYAPGPGHKRDKDHEKNKALGVDSSVGGSIAHELHRRRDALNPFFSPMRISRLDQDLTAKAAQLEGIFASASTNGDVLNLSDIYFGFCNDIIHKYCFGNSPNLLGDHPLANIHRTNVAAVLGSVKIMLHFGWMRDLMQMLPLSIGIHLMPPGVRDMVAFRKDIREQIDNILAARAQVDETPSIFTHLRDSTDLPAWERSAQRLEDEATLMIMAGTYSPMLSLLTVHYYLLAYPEIMAKLRAELAANSSAVTPTQLEQLPYLSAIIQEAHRLTFGLTGRNPRVCPDETLVFTHEAEGKTTQSYTLPAGTSLSVSTFLMHTHPSIFLDPLRFDPQRWLTDDPAELTRRRRCMLSFMRGARACVGKHLTNVEVAIAVVALARWDMRLHDSTEQDVAFCHDYHVLCSRLDPKGLRVKVLGQYIK